MAIDQAMCNSFKRQLLEGQHDFRTSGHTFKLALFLSSATLNAQTDDYSTTGEASTSNGYTAGGQPLTNVNPAIGTETTTSGTVRTSFSNETFSNVTVTAGGALIYNSTTGGSSNTTDAVVVLDFGGDKTATSGDFTVSFPTFNDSSAIIRIA